MSTTTHTRIVTHDDLDGVVSAAIVSLATGIERCYFTGPVTIYEGRAQTTEEDIVCDLPCPVRYGMWFDHHSGNLADIELRGLDVEEIPGKFSPAASCARVVYEYYRDQVQFPSFMEDTVARTDRVDSFDYSTMEQWREPLPERFLADSIIAAFKTGRNYHTYLKKLVSLFKEYPMEEVLFDEDVKTAVDSFKDLEKRSLKLIEQDTRFHDEDTDHEIAIVDLTHHNRKPDILRNLAFILYPESLAVLLIQNNFKSGRKTNDLVFSMSLSFLMNAREHSKDVGEIMRSMNLGDGHPGAGSGRLSCSSKNEMLKGKDATVDEILKMWRGFE